MSRKKKESESDVQTTESESDAKIKLFTGFKIDLPGMQLQCLDKTPSQLCSEKFLWNN